VVVPSTGNVRSFADTMTYFLTPQERGSLVFFGILTVSGIVVALVLPLDLRVKLLLVGVITITTTSVFSYSFIILPAKTKSPRSSQYLRYRALEELPEFQPKVIPPSATAKKTIMGGMCSFCGTSALMGFTCSYCHDYFCAEHRLPEKHACRGIKL
jgi:hypothetical protein